VAAPGLATVQLRLPRIPDTIGSKCIIIIKREVPCPIVGVVISAAISEAAISEAAISEAISEAAISEAAISEAIRSVAAIRSAACAEVCPHCPPLHFRVRPIYHTINSPATSHFHSHMTLWVPPYPLRIAG